MTKLLKDKNDYFFVNIIGFIGKNKIRAIYNSEQGYGGIAIFNIKTGNIKTELKTDFRIMYIYDNYIYGDNSKDCAGTEQRLNKNSCERTKNSRRCFQNKHGAAALERV